MSLYNYYVCVRARVYVRERETEKRERGGGIESE